MQLKRSTFFLLGIGSACAAFLTAPSLAVELPPRVPVHYEVKQNEPTPPPAGAGAEQRQIPRLAGTPGAGQICLNQVDLAALATEMYTEAFHQAWAEGRNGFYQSIDRAIYQRILEGRGLHNFADFMAHGVMRSMLAGEAGHPKIENLLILGGGYGRDLEYMRRYTDIPNIYVLEASPENANYLRFHYEGDSSSSLWRRENRRPEQKIWILGEDLTHDPFPEGLKFDFIVASFGTWTELSPLEKRLAVPILARASHPGTRFATEAPRGKTRSILNITRRGTFIEMRPADKPETWPAARLHPVVPHGEDIVIDRDAFIDSVNEGGYFTLQRDKDIVTYNAQCEEDASLREWYIHTRTVKETPPLPPPAVLPPRPRNYQPRPWEVLRQHNKEPDSPEKP